MAVLATWLGLTVFIHARRATAAMVFAWLCAILVVWSTAILAERLTSAPDVAELLNRLELAAGSLVPAAALHVAATFGSEGRRPPARTAIVIAAYGLSLVMAAIALAAPDQAWDIEPPHFSLEAIPGAVFGWAWVVARLAMLVLAVVWIGLPLRETGADRARRQQLLAALTTVIVGAIGGALRIVSEAAPTDPWIGVLLIAVALGTAAYAVFGQGVFLAPVAAADAFLYSVVVGIGMTAFIAAVIGIDLLVRQALAIDVPIVLGLALVVAVALFDPISERVRGLVARVDYYGMAERLERALDQGALVGQTPARALEPTLARVARSFHVGNAMVLDGAGVAVAQVGTDPRSEPGALSLPLLASAGEPGVATGRVVFGHKRSRLPFTAQEMTLLGQAAEFLADLIALDVAQERQADTLANLTERRAQVERRGAELSQALGEVASAPAALGLRVYALGPLRVERAGKPLTSWGGEKAGSRQAEAIFAFLFDRGERGVGKDEVLELVWPDVDLERADLAFHRTLGGLRTTLEPGRRARDRGEAVVFHHDRYHLDEDLIVGSDVADLATELAAAGSATEATERIGHLERARALFRGEYLDDCPFYGDSSTVEDRRELFRGQLVDLLLTLGELYEARGDRPSAAACFRQARQAAGDELPRADEALSRLGSTA
ncbi:MAG TPA: histidine kinase N-terminal 7TM domain-containing protein [Candidatus Limnocylindria bacterium]